MTNAAGRFSEAVAGRYYNDDGCPVDAQGRHQPHRFSMRTLLNSQALSPFAEEFKRRVPESHWEESFEETEGVHVASVTCVCATETLVELGHTRECSNDACTRYFWFSGAPGRGRRAVFVAYVPEGFDFDADDSAPAKPQTPAAS